MEFNEIVEAAKAGNKDALERIVIGIQDNIYGLALRMLYNPADADDATQEILIKVITHLNSFQGKSLFTTWVYKIAANYLIRYKQVEKKYSTTFLKYEDSLELESSSKWEQSEIDPAERTNYDEIRISCLQGLLLCLSRELRITYLLVDIFDINSKEGAKILGIKAEVFRKRLSRAREKLRLFMIKNCSVLKQNNPCKCGYHVYSQIGTDRFSDNNIKFAKLRSINNPEPSQLVEEMDELNQIGFIFRTNPQVKAPDKFITGIREIINSNKYNFFSN